MKTIKKNTVLLLLFIGMVALPSQKAIGQVSVSFQMFYDDLSVHGNWINDPTYGYVWSPNVSAGFAPYRTNGYWVYTDYGWTWVSNYSWGWAPFHYGRWYYDSYYGWLWAPDTVWAPAWVTWRYYDDYYGWAAIGPGVSINVALGSSYTIPANHWVFIKGRDFGKRNSSNYYVKTTNNKTFINKSTVINTVKVTNGNRYSAGPDRNHVQKRTQNKIAQVTLKERNKPGQSFNQKELQLYKPRVERNNGNRKAIPSKVINKKDNKPVAQKRIQPNIEKRNNNARIEQLARQKDNVQRQEKAQLNRMQIQEQRNTIERSERTRAQQIQQRSEPRMRSNPMQDGRRGNNFINAPSQPMRQLEPQHQMAPRGNPNIGNAMPQGMRGALRGN